MLALLTQLLIPAVSLAVELAPANSQTIVVCTAEGAVQMVVPDGGDHHKGFAGLKCHDCVMASVAAIAPSEAMVTPVAYAVRLEIARPDHDRPDVRARAPPRPPSTAPPAFLNA